LAGGKGFPILIEAGDDTFALLPLHADIIETGSGEQLFQPRPIRERAKEAGERKNGKATPLLGHSDMRNETPLDEPQEFDQFGHRTGR